MRDLRDDSCERAEDLVAYLYGEASETAARDFINHTRICAQCRTELSGFGEVREAIGAWREQALNPMTAHAAEMHHSFAPQPVRSAPKPSALAAIREFLTLSPMWLRGATAFATLLLIALTFITVMRFFENKETSVAEQKPSTVVPEKREQVAVAPVEKKNQEIAVSPSITPEPVKSDYKPERQKSVANNKSRRQNQVRQSTAPVLTKEERSQLTELLIAEKETEDEVPRLYDLLGESN